MIHQLHFSLFLFIRLLPQPTKPDDEYDHLFGTGMVGNFQKRMWNILENPNSSYAAKVRETNWHDHWDDLLWLALLCLLGCRRALVHVCRGLHPLAHLLHVANVSKERESLSQGGHADKIPTKETDFLANVSLFRQSRLGLVNYNFAKQSVIFGGGAS